MNQLLKDIRHNPLLWLLALVPVAPGGCGITKPPLADDAETLPDQMNGSAL